MKQELKDNLAYKPACKIKMKKSMKRIKYICLLASVFLMSSCFCFKYIDLGIFGQVGDPHSLSVNMAKGLNTFLCEYTPTLNFVLIDGKQVRVPIKQAFVERYVNDENRIQLVIMYNGKVELGEGHTGDIHIGPFNTRRYVKGNHEAGFDILNTIGDTNLPDSIPLYVVEWNYSTPRTAHSTLISQDTLQTVWLVKKPQ